MKDEEQKREYWYDIYGLSERRDVSTIETFIRHFADRHKSENLKVKELTLIPDIPLLEKHQLFSWRYTAEERRREERNRLSINYNPRDSIKYPEPEMIWVKTLSEAIELGVARKDQSFSLYLRSYTREDVKCLIVHFTTDSKVILGLSIAANDEFNQDNLSFAQQIRQEIEKVIPIKASTICYEQSPPDSEEEFFRFKHYLEGLAEKEADTREPFIWYDQEPSGYYHRYRESLHRRVRYFKNEPNQSDYFTLSDNQDEIINVINFHGDHLEHRRVKYPLAKDAARLAYFGDLFKKALSWENNGSNPVKIHRISVPPQAKTERIWIGHRDGVSNFTTYEGIRTSEVVIEDTFCLDKLEDLKRLAEEGFFQFNEAFLHHSFPEAYEEWLIENQHTKLYLKILQDEAALLKVNTKTLLLLVGKQSWPLLLCYLHQFKVEESELKALLTEMCRMDIWEAWQVEDIFRMVPFTSFEFRDSLSIFYGEKQFELFKQLFLKEKENRSLTNLTKGIKDSLEKKTWKQAIQFTYFYLQVIEKEYGTFCDYPLILTLAALEEYEAIRYYPHVKEYKELLIPVLKLLPKEEWRSNKLVNIALATENEYLLEKLNLTRARKNQVRQEEEVLVHSATESLGELLKKATREGNFFQVAYLAPRVAAAAIKDALKIACEEGMIGIVKILIEKRRITSDFRFDFDLMISGVKTKGFHTLHQYLLRKRGNGPWFHIP